MGNGRDRTFEDVDILRAFLGILTLSALMAVSLVPGPSSAEPVGPPEIAIADVRLDLLRADGGEFATGEHMVIANLTNVGNSSFSHEIAVTAWAMYENGTYLGTSTGTLDVAVASGETIEVVSGPLDFTPGTYEIGFDVTFGGTTIGSSADVTVRDVIDLSISNVSIGPGQEFEAGTEVAIGFDLSYEGNVGSWVDNVSAVLDIMNGPSYDFSQEIVVRDRSSKPVDPPRTFHDLTFPTWVARPPGMYTVRIKVPYLDDDPINNMVSFPITVFQLPSVRGNVTSGGLPLPHAIVVLYRGPALVWVNRTDGEGRFEIFDLASGNYTLNVTHEWAVPIQRYIAVEAGTTLNVTVELEPLDKGNLEGTVKVHPMGVPAAYATVAVEMEPTGPSAKNATVTANESGGFSIPMLDAGHYLLTARHPGFGSYNGSVTVLPRTTVYVEVQIPIVEFVAVRFDPPNGTIDHPMNASVEVEFSRSIDPSTVTNITIFDEEGMETVPVRYDNNPEWTAVILDPVEDLLPLSIYHIAVSPSLRASTGDPLGAWAMSSFRTEGDRFPVTVLSDPGPGEAGVPLGVKISATFSESMVPATLNDGSFVVLEDGAERVQGSIEVSINGRTATFTPLRLLKLETRYVVVLTDDISPVDTFSVFRGHTFEFFTIDSSAPGSVKGRLLDPDGNPLAGQEVKVHLIRAGMELSADVDDDGWFLIEGVPTGRWTLEVRAPGYETMTRVIEVDPGETTQVGNLKPQEELVYDYSCLVFFITAIATVVIFAIIIVKARKANKGEGTAKEAPRYPTIPSGPAPPEPAGKVLEGPVFGTEEALPSMEVSLRPSLRSMDNTLCLEVAGGSVDASLLEVELNGIALENAPGAIFPSDEYRIDTGMEIMPGDDYHVSVTLDGERAFEGIVTAQP